PATVPTASRTSLPGGACGPRPSTAGAPRPSATGLSAASGPVRWTPWSPPTSRPGASTSTASPASSTSTCPATRRTTCTGRAAPAGPAPPARSCRWSPRTAGGRCGRCSATPASPAPSNAPTRPGCPLRSPPPAERRVRLHARGVIDRGRCRVCPSPRYSGNVAWLANHRRGAPRSPPDPGEGQMDDDPVLLEVDGGVAVVTLNRPERHNALDDAADALLHRYLDLLRSDRAVRAVVWRAEGGSFSTGRDVAELLGEPGP